MQLQLGAFVDLQGIIQANYRRWRYRDPESEKYKGELTSLLNKSKDDLRNVLNKEIDKQEARIAALEKEDQRRRVHGHHFGKKDELLLHDETAALLATADSSEASSFQRSLWTFWQSHRTATSSVFTGDEVAPPEPSVSNTGNHRTSTSISNADRLWFWFRFKFTINSIWTKQPIKQDYLGPCWIVVSIKSPPPQAFRSLDIPCLSSVASYNQKSYFPETDTFFLPLAAGGPFEVAATEIEKGRWIELTDEKVWKYRESALEELMLTGGLHWRKVDRWGRGWQEGRWREVERPTWDQAAKKWRCEVMRS